jgi:hypothetical protein
LLTAKGTGAFLKARTKGDFPCGAPPDLRHRQGEVGTRCRNERAEDDWESIPAVRGGRSCPLHRAGDAASLANMLTHGFKGSAHPDRGGIRNRRLCVSRERDPNEHERDD